MVVDLRAGNRAPTPGPTAAASSRPFTCGSCGGIALAAAGEDVGKIGQLVVGAQLDEQVEHFVQHFLGRASGRSILLITTIGFSPHSRALESTNRVCGIGPSAASTSTSAPSAMRSTRSTSPPKSAWPGRVDHVDLHALVMQGDVLGQDRDAPLALQLVGVEDAIAHQLARAELAALAEQASTSVVLPWSTWAMMAMLRMSLRRMVSRPRAEGLGLKGRFHSLASVAEIGPISWEDRPGVRSGRAGVSPPDAVEVAPWRWHRQFAPVGETDADRRACLAAVRRMRR